MLLCLSLLPCFFVSHHEQYCDGQQSQVVILYGVWMMQEVDRVVARLRGRENEQHDALGPVQTFVNAHMQVTTHPPCFQPQNLLDINHCRTS